MQIWPRQINILFGQGATAELNLLSRLSLFICTRKAYSSANLRRICFHVSFDSEANRSLIDTSLLQRTIGFGRSRRGENKD